MFPQPAFWTDPNQAGSLQMTTMVFWQSCDFSSKLKSDLDIQRNYPRLKTEITLMSQRIGVTNHPKITELAILILGYYVSNDNYSYQD